MPFFLFFVAVIFIVAGYRGTQKDLFKLLAGDFTGWNSFIPWVVSILAIGAVGYVPKLKGVSDGFLFLVLLSLVLSRQGFFNNLMSQLQSAPASTGGDGGATAPGVGPLTPTAPSSSGAGDGSNTSTSVSGSTK